MLHCKKLLAGWQETTLERGRVAPQHSATPDPNGVQVAVPG